MDHAAQDRVRPHKTGPTLHALRRRFTVGDILPGTRLGQEVKERRKDGVLRPESARDIRHRMDEVAATEMRAIQKAGFQTAGLKQYDAMDAISEKPKGETIWPPPRTPIANAKCERARQNWRARCS